MLKHQIKLNGRYIARISGRLVTVQVDAIREIDGWGPGRGSIYRPASKAKTVYDVTNLATGRKTTFRSASKFRWPDSEEKRQ